ncbi:MAG: ATP-binding protein [Clostridia bacterium]|nr:ATP-binding protein [Clostridia bacterium]
MSYSNSTRSKATQILAERRRKAQRLQQAHHLTATEKLPEIAAYEAQLAETGLAVVKALSMGKDGESYIAQLSQMNQTVQSCIRALLVQGGFPADYLETPYTCKQCEDTGFVGGYACECRKTLLAELSRQALESVAPSAQCTFDTFSLDYYPLPVDAQLGVSPRKRMAEILDYCRSYAEDFGPDSESLYMHGATGLGKTHLSLAIANTVTAQGYSVIYDSAQNLLAALEREKFGGGTGERAQELLDCDLLIIDDLGSEFSTSFTVAAVYNLINTRINRQKPVIISTNLTETELEAKYSQRITSRIIGSYVSLLFLGKDIRQIKKYNEA